MAANKKKFALYLKFPKQYNSVNYQVWVLISSFPFYALIFLFLFSADFFQSISLFTNTKIDPQ